MKTGVIFDLDGVLIDSEELQYRAYAEVLAGFAVAVEREEYGREWIAAGRGPEYAVEKYGLGLRPDDLRALKNPVYHRILERDIELMPGVMEALMRLAHGFALAVATNSNATDVGFVMRRFGLERFFDAVISRERYVRAKPEPDAFLTAAAALGLPPGRCVVIEDAHKGVVAAHRAGARCIAIPHAFTEGNDFSLADRIVGSLDEVTAELIAELAGSGP